MTTEAPALRTRYAMLPEVAATSPNRHTFPHRLNVTTLTAGGVADAATGTPAGTDKTATRAARTRRIRMPSRSVGSLGHGRKSRSQDGCYRPAGSSLDRRRPPVRSTG